ncbi:MAG: hypothetical protein EPO23_06490 [Xanthobacteraceae bacterium]|nr:MAG: hypothetical protein EPO23_06490 [Xanthobacteraceae bacterium]
MFRVWMMVAVLFGAMEPAKAQIDADTLGRMMLQQAQPQIDAQTTLLVNAKFGPLLATYSDEGIPPPERLAIVYLTQQIVVYCHALGNRGRMATLVTDIELARSTALSKDKEDALAAKLPPQMQADGKMLTKEQAKALGKSMAQDAVDSIMNKNEAMDRAMCRLALNVAMTNRMASASNFR